MILSEAELRERVVRVVAEALDRKPAEITPHASLIDDLGAESIDFLDIAFRLEAELGLEIPNDEIWRGTFGGKSPDDATIERGVEALRKRLPDFRWDRFPNGIARAELPRLITVTTMLDYLGRALDARNHTPRDS
jgi:acyl carrier protein